MIAQVTRYCIAFCLFFMVNAHADVVKLPSQPPQVVTSDSAPVRGMSKQQVESAHGAPRAMSGPVGTPAIYRWDYAEYSVFFEHDYVIHSVVTSSN